MCPRYSSFNSRHHAFEPGLARMDLEAGLALQQCDGSRPGSHPGTEPHRPAGHRIRPARVPCTARRTSSSIWPAVHLDNQECTRTLRSELLDHLRRERADSDRSQQTNLDALLARRPHSRERNASCGAEADDHKLGIVEEVFLVADFIGLDMLPALQQAQIG